MASRLIMTLFLLAVTTMKVAAERIELPELDLRKVPKLERIISYVSEKGDSIYDGEKVYKVSLFENKGKIYVGIGMVKRSQIPYLHDSKYMGFYRTDGGVFVIVDNLYRNSIIKTRHREQFECDSTPRGFDGTVEWLFYILDGKIYIVHFTPEW